jgi:serine/threonine-protein kinase HipA
MLMGSEATKDFIRRLVFTIAIANADMHLKNWSVIYRDRVTPVLAPAYDFVCIAAYPRYDDKLALPLHRTVSWEKLRKETFLQAAQYAKPAVPAHLIHEALEESITAILDSWKLFQNDDRLPPPVKKIIERQLTTVPLFQSSG